MPKKRTFIDKIREIKAAPGKRATIPVPGADGLYVRVGKNKSFTIISRLPDGGKQVWARVPIHQIGAEVDTLTEEQLDEVRVLAREGIARIKRGEREAFPPPPAGPESLKNIADNFMRRYVRGTAKLVSADEVERKLRTYVYPEIGDCPINEIKRSDIAHLLDRIEDKNGATQADRVLAVLRKLFHWHEARDDEFISPVVKGMTRTNPAERRRQRVMSDNELRVLWPLLGEAGTYGAILKTLLLTAQRLGKVRHMKWADINDGIWEIPVDHRREKASAGKLPLPDMVLEIIEAQPKIDGNPFVFPASRGNGAFNGYPKAKANLDKAFAQALAAEYDVGLEPWVLHSLRHTAKTIMARIGVAEFDSERTLGHVISGIGGTYNHYSHTEEKGAALERLAAEIQRINNPPEDDDKVVRAEFGKAAE